MKQEQQQQSHYLRGPKMTTHAKDRLSFGQLDAQYLQAISKVNNQKTALQTTSRFPESLQGGPIDEAQFIQMISNAQDDVCSDDQSEEDMSEMEVIIRTIQNEVTGLKRRMCKGNAMSPSRLSQSYETKPLIVKRDNYMSVQNQRSQMNQSSLSASAIAQEYLQQKYARQSQRSAGNNSYAGKNASRTKGSNHRVPVTTAQKPNESIPPMQVDETTTEERLFKFSPLSSKKFEGENNSNNQATTQSHANFNNNSGASPLFQNNQVNRSRDQQHNQSADGIEPSQSYLQNRQRSAFINQPVRQTDQSFDQSPMPVPPGPNISVQGNIRQPNFDQEHSTHLRDSTRGQQQSSSLVRESSVVHTKQPRTQTPQTAVRGHQTNIQPSKKMNIETQTDRQRSLSPFETYDVLFVKDLVNNLNGDNEVLTENIEDLKKAFFYLYEKHKGLLRSYKKECMNRQVVDSQRVRIDDLLIETGQLANENLKLRSKVGSLFDIMRISWQEHEVNNQEAEEHVIQLEMENHHLRSLLALQVDDDKIFPSIEIEDALREQEKILEEIEIDRVDQERRDREHDIESLKGDIERLLREEYESKWQEAMLAATHSAKESSSAPPSSNEKDNNKFSGSKQMHNKDEDDEDIEEDLINHEPQLQQTSFDPIGDSAGSSGNFASLFDGEALTAEEQALLRHLKQREKESNLKIVVPVDDGPDHIIGSPTDFAAIDMDDDDDDEEDEEEQMSPKQVVQEEDDDDEDVKTLQLLLQQSKGFYTTSASNDNMEDEDDDFDQYEEQNAGEDEDEEDEFDQHFRYAGPRGLDENPTQSQAQEEENITPTAHNLAEEQKSPDRKSRRAVVVGQKKTVNHSSQQPLPASREHQFYFDDQDEENFFEELTQDFNRAQQLGGFFSGASRLTEESLQQPANDQLDNSRLKQSELIEGLRDDRDEAKEDEYDYFLDTQNNNAAVDSQENVEGRVDYHVMDDNQADDEDDEEMLDEDEKRQRNNNMLKELYDKIQHEEGVQNDYEDDFEDNDDM